MAKNICIVSELYYPETTSTGHFLTGIAEGLAKTWSVRVICSQPTYSAYGIRAPKSEVCNGVEILRVYSPLLDKDVLLFRMLNLLVFSVSVFLNLLRRITTNSIVIVVTNPPTIPFVVTLACMFRRAKCILLVHDVYPEVLVSAGLASEGSWVIMLLNRLSRWLYNRMAAIVVIGRDMERLVRQKIGSAHRIELIPNWADLEEIRPTPRSQNQLLRRLGLVDKFVVQYSGNMGRTHGLEDILVAAQMLIDDPRIRFLLIGAGSRKGWLIAEVARLQLQNVIVLHLQDRDALCDSLNAADVAVISFLPGMSGVSVPSRMYNVLAAGKPIVAIADVDSELGTLVVEKQVGWVVPPHSTASLSRVLRSATQDGIGLATMAQRARRVVENEYGIEQVIAKYSALIEGL